MTTPEPRPGVMDVAPYVGGSHEVAGADRVIVLSANENPLGPSEHAKEAYRAAAGTLHRYPEGGAEDLRQAIGERFGLDPGRIVCGAGSDELISLLIKAYAGPGDEVLQSQYGFLMYAISAKTAGATPVMAPETNLTANVDALLDHVTDRTRLLFLANPNNPTGTYLPASELRRLRENLREDVILVVDAAYAEYVEAADYGAGADLATECDNVVMLRTFSKIFGLAALRLGWAYGPPAIIDVLNRVRGPFNTTAPAQAAGIAAVGDEDHMRASRAHNSQWMAWLTQQIGGLGPEVPPSAGNFILVRFADKAKADAAYQFLWSRGIIARLMGGYGLPESIRVTVGLEDENRALVEALAEHLEAS
ncbi:MAG: histidinol-phosphate transaminase [Alphaproteobacteria bacterium]|nr:histidinol-phosphate transaminase [Alphaproteobacteria bacterium]